MGRPWRPGRRQGEEAAGKVTGDEDLEAEGKGEQMTGKVKETIGKVNEKVKDLTDYRSFDSRRGAAQWPLPRVSGRARQRYDRPRDR